MITDMLREAILSGELAAGVQLKQEEWASRLNVSMSALREALKGLEAEGLVRFNPNRGAIVSELSAAEVREIFDIRLFLEAGALELAIPELSADDFDQAEALLSEADTQSDNQSWGSYNWQFHERLYRAAKRPKLLSMIQSLHNNVERYMRIYLSALHFQTKSQAEHRALLQACRQRDVLSAKAILRQHMQDASAQLSGYLQR